MPKKVVTRRQRKAAEAKRKAEEDTRFESKSMVGGGGDMSSAGDGASTKVSSNKPPTHGNPLPEEQAFIQPPIKLSRRQKKKAKRRTKKNLESTSTKASDMRPSSSKKTTTLVDTISKINSDTPSTWYDACNPQQPAPTLEPKPSSEQSNRVVPFGTRLCRRIARRFRPVPEKAPHHLKPELDDKQPTLRQLAALNRVIRNKKNTHFQEEVLEALKQCGKNPLANLMHPPEQRNDKQNGAASGLKIEKQAADILEKYLQNYQDRNESKATVTTTNKRQKKSKLKPTRFPQAATSMRQERDVEDKIIVASLAPEPMALPMVPKEQSTPLKIVGHTGYFILSGTNEQLAQQFHDLEDQHVSIRKCLLLLAGMTEKVEQQLEDLDKNRQQILKHMHDKHVMLAPKRQRRQKRPHKHVQVDKAGRANANRKENPKKQRGTILAPAAERSAATC